MKHRYLPYVLRRIVERSQNRAGKGLRYGKNRLCSGEGGILPEEKQAACKYIFEDIPNKYSVTDENLCISDAIEIKIGQGTKPGMGGHLPGEKVTAEIAAIRGKKQGEDVQSPSKFPELNTKEDLRDMEAASVFEKSRVKEWECRNYGHIVVGAKAPGICPVCAHPQSCFEVSLPF